ncbi:histone-lysine N-methyltransferase PRDM9-like isoform X1 [Tachysurus ichikawai]
MQMELCSTSDGRTLRSVGHVPPVEQDTEFWKKPLKEEETDEDDLYGGTSSSVGEAEDQQNREFHIMIKEEEPKHDDYLCKTEPCVRLSHV